MASTNKVAKNDNPDTFESLSEVFRCFICMEKLHDARLCPHCSKLCCYTCIRKWITETRSQCPHCRASLHIYELINCRWVDEVTQQLENLQQSQSASSRSNNGCIENGDPTASSDKCEAHGERLSVFCSTCNSVICHQCALFDGKHEQHSFRPLDEVYDERVLQIETEMDLAMDRHLDLISLSREVEKNVQTVKQAREERVRELRSAIELMITRLDSQLKSKLDTLTDQRNQLSQEIETLGTLLTSIKFQIAKKSHAEIVTRSSEYLNAISEMYHRSMTAFVSAPVPADFVSEIVPPYDSSTFIVNNYSVLRQRADPVYSPPLHIGRLSWRIKVYPDGNGVGRGNYISVFIELTTSSIEPSNYEYRIEMVHQASRDPSRSVMREFTSHFEGGESWGFNRFFRLDLLASEGYLDVETDVLVFNFQVRAPTYFQKCRDQQWHIAHLEATRGECFSQLAELKERLEMQMAQQTTDPNTSENVAVEDKSVPHDFASSSVVAGQNVAVTASAGDDESRVISDTAILKYPIPVNAPTQAGEGNFTSRSADEVPLGQASESTGPQLPGWCSMLNFPVNGSEQGTESDAIASSRTTHEDDRSARFVNSPLGPSSADVVEEDSDSDQGTDPNFQSSEVTAQPTSFSYPPQPTVEPPLGLLVSSNTQNLTRSILSSVDLSPFTASYDSEDQGIIGLLASQEATDNNQMYETIEDGADHRDSEEERSNLEEPVTHSEHSADAALPGSVERPVEFSEGDDDGYDANQQAGGSAMYSHHNMEQRHTDENDYQSSQHRADDSDEYESLSAEDSPRTRSEPNLRKPLNQTAASTSAAAFALALNISSSFEKPYDFDCDDESSVDDATDDNFVASGQLNDVQGPQAFSNPETILHAYQATDDGQDCSGNFSLIEDMLCLPAPRNTTFSRHQPHHCNGNQKRDAFRRRSDRNSNKLFRFRFTPKPRSGGVAAGGRNNLRFFINGTANRCRHSNSSALESTNSSDGQECHPDKSNWHWNSAIPTSQAVNERANPNCGSDHISLAPSSNSAFRSLVHTTRFPGLSAQNGITDQTDDFLLVQGACARIPQTADLLTGEDCNAVPVSLANRLFFRRLKRLSKETRLLKQSIQNLENDVDNETGTGDRDVSEHAEMVHSRRPTSANVSTYGSLIADEHIGNKPRSTIHSSRTMAKAKAATTSPQIAASSNLLGSNACECRFSDTSRINLSNRSTDQSSRDPAASAHSRRPSVRGDNGSSKGEIQNRGRTENLSANTPSRSEQRLHELSEHNSAPCPTPTSLTKPEDQLITFQSSNYTPDNQNTSLHGRLSSLTQVVTEKADVTLEMLCERLTRLQTEAEAVARAITSTDPSQSTSVVSLTSDQFSRSTIEDKSETSGPNRQGGLLCSNSANGVAVASANRESQSNGVSPRDRDARNQSMVHDQAL